MKKAPSVCVLMATYNGEAFVAEQIESILLQRDVNVHLIICDDRSSDSTLAICEAYACEFDNVEVRMNDENKGVARNFLDMLASCDADSYDYFAFSDQDDVWLPNKLKHADEALRPSSGKACLYYTDTINVDADLGNPRSGYSSYETVEDKLRLLLVCNWAAGCTMVFNSSLCRLIQAGGPMENSRGHDSWIHMIALTCGNAKADFKNPQILRRIYGGNVVGEDLKLASSGVRFADLCRRAASREISRHGATDAARELLLKYGNLMPDEERQTVETFASCQHSMISRLNAAMFNPPQFPSMRETMLARLKMLMSWY